MLKVKGGVRNFGCVVYHPNKELFEETGADPVENLEPYVKSFVVPLVDEGKNVLAGYLFRYGHAILQLLLEPFMARKSKDSFQGSTTDMLNRFYKATYCPLVVDALSGEYGKQRIQCHLLVLYPKEPLVAWVNGLVGKGVLPAKGIDIESIMKKQFAIGILLDGLHSKEERGNFITENHIQLFELTLSLYCLDKSSWPTALELGKFNDWIHWEYTRLYEIGDARVEPKSHSS